MHGRNRKEYKERGRSPVVLSKAMKVRALESELLKRRKESSAAAAAGLPTDPAQADRPTKDDLDLTQKYLLVNPDPLWAWSYRRKLLRFDSEEQDGPAATTPTTPTTIEEELNLTTSCLLMNPKCYGTWLHRKWLSAHHPGRIDFWRTEMERTGDFLAKDERNFHCWNYRRYLLGLMLANRPPPSPPALDNVGIRNASRLLSLDPQVDCTKGSSAASPLSDTDQGGILNLEWDFTTQKIQQNFSNFSAFHYRTSLVCDVTRERLRSDWDLVENALFTDPFDQTAWWYLRFLSSQTWTPPMPELWQRLAENLRDLRSSEPDCKWVILGILLLHFASSTEFRFETESDQAQLWRSLRQLDPVRKGLYHASFLRNA